jgi:hypothetical protein
MASSVLEPIPASARRTFSTAAIVASALVLRVVATIMVFVRCPPATALGGHSEILAVAKSLAEGHGFSSPFFASSGPTAFLAPGYPLFVAGIFKLFGVSAGALVVVVTLQIAFSTLTVWLAMRVAERCFGTATANIAGCICAFLPSLILTPFFVWETCLSSLLLLLLFAMLPGVHTRTQWAAAGAGSAITVLINPALLPTLAALALWRAFRSRTIPWIGILAFLLVYAPWPARNLASMHTAILLRSNFGYELWMGNHPGGNGDFDQRLDPESNAGERAQFVSLGELPFMRAKTAASLAYIRTHRGEFLGLTARRIFRFWTSDGEGFSVTATLLSLLALTGLALAWRWRTEVRTYAIPLAIYPLPYYLTHTDPRFLRLIEPLLAILAAYAMSRAVGILTSRSSAASRSLEQGAVQLG